MSLLERSAQQSEGTTGSGIWAGGAMEQESGPQVYSSAGG